VSSLAEVLIREICNSIIAQAVRYINGGDIFTMISSEETVECYAKLENTSRICTAFKACGWKKAAAILKVSYGQFGNNWVLEFKTSQRPLNSIRID